MSHNPDGVHGSSSRGGADEQRSPDAQEIAGSASRAGRSTCTQMNIICRLSVQPRARGGDAGATVLVVVVNGSSSHAGRRLPLVAATHVRLRFILVRGEAAADVRLQLLPFSVHPRVRGGDTRMSRSRGSACGSSLRAGIRLHSFAHSCAQ